jgi:PII-like signaling protein
VSIHVTVHDRSGHRSLTTELLRRARGAGLAGATVFQAVEGFGASGRTHRTHLVAEDAPVTVVVVDRPEAVEAFLAGLGDLLSGVLVVTEDVDIVEV